MDVGVGGLVGFDRSAQSTSMSMVGDDSATDFEDMRMIERKSVNLQLAAPPHAALFEGIVGRGVTVTRPVLFRGFDDRASLQALDFGKVD